ncbi:MAG TPA: ATP-binding protein [Chloroflexaceae bacterium]|nr:ATP-binding protein [Chloroflexaceae bacterium]
MPSSSQAPRPLSRAQERDIAEHYEQLLHEQERARLAAEAAAARSSRLLTITAALSRALTPERVAALVVEAARDVTGAVAGHVSLLDPAGEALTILASDGYPEHVVGRWGRLPLTVPSPLSDAVLRAEPVVIASLEQLAERYPTFARSLSSDRVGVWVALPLTLDAKVVGALGFSYGAPARLGDEERTFLMTLGGLCAQALERARLMEAEREALAAADEALALLDTVFDSAPIGLAVMDLDFRYTRINRRLAEFNGRPAAEHLGRQVSELYPRVFALAESHWRQVLATGEPVLEVELSLPVPGGRLRHALVSYYPVRVGGGPVVGVGMVVADITERKEAEQERLRLLGSEQAARAAAEEAQARAEAALQLRETFLSVAAHELKTPLTSLLGQAQLLERRLSQAGLLGGPNERSLQVVVGQARRLSHLIGALLDGAQLESGHLVIDLKPVDIGALVRRIVEEARPMLVGHTLSCTVDGTDLRVRGDAVRLEQILQNLVSNAAKYSPQGSTIAIGARREGAAVTVSVADEGIGISADLVPHLFERFYRVESPETRGVSGVGVGLYVVRELVRLHGGTVEVRSAPGEGSSFIVRLPGEGTPPLVPPGGAAGA